MDLSQDTADAFVTEPVGRTNGIDCYVEEDYYRGELDRHEAITLVELARRVGWRRAIQALPSGNLARSMSDPTRLRFLDFLAVGKGSSILDFGASWGSLSVHMARRFPSCQVYALDETLEGLAFLDIVKTQEGLSNLRIAKTGVDRIPLADESMDIVLMIGVLEWVGEILTNTTPNLAQLAVLSEVRRTLKKGGKLVLGVENRYSYRYLGGRPDHSHIRFGSIIPRRLASFYSSRFRRREYRTYIYSLGEYTKILKQVAYKDVQFYCAYPDHASPRVISDLGSMHEFWNNSNAPGSGLLKYLPNSALKRVVPSYLIFARK